MADRKIITADYVNGAIMMPLDEETLFGDPEASAKDPCAGVICEQCEYYHECFAMSGTETR
jgi:hypothetical protein